MFLRTLSPEHDPLGAAMADYLRTGSASRLRVFSSMFDEDELPVAELFRTEKRMPLLERKALSEARGRVLDVGAGSGCHTVALQLRGLEVDAIDVSPLAVGVMKERGVRHALNVNLFDSSWSGSYDTILMLMNGFGMVGRLADVPAFFRRMRELLAPGGAVLVDSSDLCYVYEDEDGRIDTEGIEGYYGEVDYRMRYKQVEGEPFDWLYIDFDTLARCAAENGFRADKVLNGTHYDYLARLMREEDV